MAPSVTAKTTAMGQLRVQNSENQSPPTRNRGVRKITRNATPSTALRSRKIAFIFTWFSPIIGLS